MLVLKGYLCPHEIATLLRLRDLAGEFGDRVVLREVPLTLETLREYGAAKGFFINGRPKLGGGETEEAVRRAILEEF